MAGAGHGTNSVVSLLAILPDLAPLGQGAPAIGQLQVRTPLSRQETLKFGHNHKGRREREIPPAGRAIAKGHLLRHRSAPLIQTLPRDGGSQHRKNPPTTAWT